MRKLLGLLLTSSIIASCSNQVNTISAQKNVSLLSKESQLRLEEAFKLEKATGESGESSFVAIADAGNFDDVVSQIIAGGGEITHFNSMMGYIAFRANARTATELNYSKKIEALAYDDKIEFKEPKFDPQKVSENGKVTLTKNLYPAEVMQVNSLVQDFKEQGIALDGSSSTIAVFDTGLDISRTDVFQDRIVELRTLRDTDHAKVIEANSEIIDGKEYLTAVIDNQEIKIERTEKLQADRQYYVGYFTEKQFSELKYKRIDFNQDGEISAIFPVVAFKNNDGNFEVYINVNSSLTYGAMGDDSIEDENKLLDFNWVAKNLEDRFHEDKKNPFNSYYKYTTKMDIVKKDPSGNTVLSKDRNKGIVNFAVTVERGFELDEEGKFINKAYQGQPAFYNIGLVGFDAGGHGTHCAGTAAGNFQAAPQFSSGAKNAKIVGGTLLGTGYRYSDYFKLLDTVIRNHKNLVFSFSFGSNTAINALGGTTAKYYDAAAKQFGVSFVKAAGNEGPGINSHGAGPALWSLDVANFYSSNSRNSYNVDGDYLGEDKLFVSPSSSRGPMYDGALKPDIGAPGYVMSSIPLAKEVGGERRAYEYMPGTSMATPNVASVVALLYDAATKTGLNDGTSIINPFSVDKLHKAVKNSALSYDEMTVSECQASFGKTGVCDFKAKKRKFGWIEGGAGRINAQGAWKVLNDIIHEDVNFISTKTTSTLTGYEGYAIGFYAYDNVPSQGYFWPMIPEPTNPSDYLKIKSYTLKIDADWIYFDRNLTKKEKIIEIVPGEKPEVDFYFDRKKLMENGRLKPGMHATVIKAYSIDNPDYFDWVFPVTLIGSNTHFDPVVDEGSFSVQGFVPAGQFARYFIPVDSKQSALMLDLHTSNSLPGSLMMSVYYQGMEIDYKKLGTNSYWAVSGSDYLPSRNNVRYVLQDLQPGVYEVIVKSSTQSMYEFEGEFGSYYNLDVNRLSVDIDNVREYRNTKTSKVVLSGVSSDKYLKLAKAEVSTDRLRMRTKVEVKHQEKKEIAIEVTDQTSMLAIFSSYTGNTQKMDIDLALLDETGKRIKMSGNQDSNEQIIISSKSGLKPGSYTLVIDGYNVPSEGELFDIEVFQLMSEKLVVANEFTDSSVNKTIGGKSSYLKANKKYDFTAMIDMSILDSLPKLEGYEAVFSVDISAVYGNNGERVSIFSGEAK